MRRDRDQAVTTRLIDRPGSNRWMAVSGSMDQRLGSLGILDRILHLSTHSALIAAG